MEYSDHNDFISDFDYDADSKTLVASSGQGTISIYDIRKPNMLAMSENQDDELLSICIVKDRRKVVVGSQEGVLNIYSWGDWGDCTDRFLGHPNSIDTICKIDEDTVATGSSDGIIRYELEMMIYSYQQLDPGKSMSLWLNISCNWSFFILS